MKIEGQRPGVSQLPPIRLQIFTQSRSMLQLEVSRSLVFRKKPVASFQIGDARVYLNQRSTVYFGSEKCENSVRFCHKDIAPRYMKITASKDGKVRLHIEEKTAVVEITNKLSGQLRTLGTYLAYQKGILLLEGDVISIAFGSDKFFISFNLEKQEAPGGKINPPIGLRPDETNVIYREVLQFAQILLLAGSPATFIRQASKQYQNDPDLTLLVFLGSHCFDDAVLGSKDAELVYSRIFGLFGNNAPEAEIFIRDNAKRIPACAWSSVIREARGRYDIFLRLSNETILEIAKMKLSFNEGDTDGPADLLFARLIEMAQNDNHAIRRELPSIITFYETEYPEYLEHLKKFDLLCCLDL